MTAQMIIFRKLVLKDLDPAYFDMDREKVDYWAENIVLLKEQMFVAMQEEMMGSIPNGLLERHLKQVIYDCSFLMNELAREVDRCVLGMEIEDRVETCLEEIITHIEGHYADFFDWQREAVKKETMETPDYRIRVLLSVDSLAYFFKLLHKARALDTGPTTQLMTAITKNFVTPGVGQGYISVNSLTTKYKQVVTTTSISVRLLLVRMIRLIDEEFG